MSGSVRTITQTALKGSANACSSFGHLDEKYTYEKSEEFEEEETNQEEEEKELAKGTGTNRKRKESEAKHTEKEEKGKELAKDVGKFVVTTALITGVVIGGTTLALPAIGFGTLGPISGSLAAAYQSTVLGGTIASGSAFATLQSLGMIGLPAAAKMSIAGVSAALSAAITTASKLKKKKDEDKKGS